MFGSKVRVDSTAKVAELETAEKVSCVFSDQLYHWYCLNSIVQSHYSRMLSYCYMVKSGSGDIVCVYILVFLGGGGAGLVLELRYLLNQ